MSTQHKGTVKVFVSNSNWARKAVTLDQDPGDHAVVMLTARITNSGGPPLSKGPFFVPFYDRKGDTITIYVQSLDGKAHTAKVLVDWLVVP